MHLLALVVMVSLPPRLSPADQAARTALRRAVTRLEKNEISQEQFEELQPRSRIATWLRLQRRIPSPRSGSADLAFVLAYYGVEYPRNLQRLLLPYRRWRRAASAGAPMPSVHEAAVLENLAEDLIILYRKRHDARSLGSLLDLPFRGAPDEAALNSRKALYFQQLWSGHEETVLRVASRSPVRLGNVAKMLAEENEHAGDRKAVLDDVRRFTHDPDRRVAQAAGKVIFLLEAEPSR
jgi:hypothetical protein